MAGSNVKLIGTPDLLLELYNKYKVWAELNPLQIQDYVGGAGKEVMRLKPRAISMEGFYVWGYNNGVCFENYISNQNGSYGDYSEVAKYIKQDIRCHQIEGGMAGIYNPQITQRLNGLVEKTENKNENTGDITVTFKID